MKIGMTFIEVLIAIVILGIVLSSMFTGLNFATKYARHNANKTMALNFAQALMEDLKDVPYNNLEGWDGYPYPPVQLYQGVGADIQATRSVDVEDEDDEEGEDGDEEDDYVYTEITVSVSWNWLGKSYTEELNTRRYNY